MPVATKTGRKQMEAAMPANRHISQTGKLAPATLITGSHPGISKAEIQAIDQPERK
jgi:hypothetical protein